MDLEEKRKFVLATLRPMAEYTFPYVASVIGVPEPSRGEHLGSALRCVLSGKRALVTAHHVIQAATERYPAFAISAGYGVPPYLVQGEVRCDVHGDLAVYFFPEDYPRRADIAYWPETRIEHNHERLATDYLFVHGFPGVRSYSSRLLSGVVNKSLPYGTMQRLREEGLPEDLDDANQFALNFDPRHLHVAPGESPEFLPDPKGLSGGPVWRIGVSGRPTAEWTPDQSLLVGIVTHWQTEKELLVATYATRLLNLVSQTKSSH